ncbi:valine--tRNA ligase [Lactococcus sp.]|uniref:valine--tRNA ligase n=1 Tax=Lactococcus sp. TaxID=44273 RepID=UPI0035B3ACA1
MTEELSTKFNPTEVEAGRYEKWVNSGVFKPSGDKKAHPYSIVIPPPNVTGKLHLGHAWDTTLQDIIIRQKRMQGFDTLWLPGMDHAGIATQAKVAARLAEDGILPQDLGREKFIDKVWEWKDEYATTIKQQWGKMGISVDYSRERFTLDEGLNKAVKKVFVELYKKGWIYQGEKIINWDPKAMTALSDIEVIHKDVEGAFYHVNYASADGSIVLEVATTRPETFFGDTAVAVNPADERYAKYIGKTVVLPIINKEIPIIGDEHADMEKGTGVVKITPAHDPNDFLVGQRHDLPMPNVMNADGTMNELCGADYNGLDRFEARKKVVAEFEKMGILVKVEPIHHEVGHSERTGVIVEPRLSKQWFVKMDQLAKQAMDNQDTDDKVNFYPPRFEDTFMQWMGNVHDWVISRQLWWGHQIPAWYRGEEVYVGEEAPEGEGWTQEEDVLDTWFSSALWPFSTMGWPDTESEDFLRYFPTSTLVTGYDIIFFWVSRMIFQSLEFTKKAPFRNVLIHGLIRDEEGRKMSKSLGNGIDPMDVVEKYGADALRWFLSNGSAPGQDVRFSYDKMDAAWNFINKIWNVSRYILMNAGEMSADQVSSALTKVADKTAGNVTDRWILTRLNDTIERVTEQMDKFEFGVAGHILYNFIWNEFANWYLELTKEVMFGEDEAEKDVTRAVLLHVLDNVLRLLHPIMPFFTEEVFEKMPNTTGSIVVAEYPVARPEFNDEKATDGVALLIELITAVRNIRAEVNTPLSKKVPMFIKSDYAEFLEGVAPYITRFANPSELTIAKELKAPEQSMSAVVTGAEIYLPLAGLINIDEEIARLEKELEKWQKEVDMVNKKLSNERFVQNAKPEIVEKERAKLAAHQEKFDSTKARIDELKK